MSPRRLVLAAVVFGLVGTSGTAAFANDAQSGDGTKRVCVVGTSDPTTNNWEGVCVWVPIH